jgi:hypothetical protein
MLSAPRLRSQPIAAFRNAASTCGAEPSRSGHGWRSRPSASTDVFLAEWSTQEIERVRDDLAGVAPTTLERPLAKRVALTWFDANEADARFPASAKSDHFVRYRDRANRRFLEAAKTLA